MEREYILADLQKKTNQNRASFFARNHWFGVCLRCRIVFGLSEPGRESAKCSECGQNILDKNIVCPVCKDSSYAFEVDFYDAKFLSMGNKRFPPMEITVGIFGERTEPVEDKYE